MKTTLLATCLLTLTLLAGGCQSEFDSADLRSDWTPELKSVAMSGEQYKNSRSRHRHNYQRQIHDDWSMIWLDNRNLRLNQNVLP